eukprot:9872121-Heterocapsa_arctica.AAC.1
MNFWPGHPTDYGLMRKQLWSRAARLVGKCPKTCRAEEKCGKCPTRGLYGWRPGGVVGKRLEVGTVSQRAHRALVDT